MKNMGLIKRIGLIASLAFWVLGCGSAGIAASNAVTPNAEDINAALTAIAVTAAAVPQPTPTRVPPTTMPTIELVDDQVTDLQAYVNNMTNYMNDYTNAGTIASNTMTSMGNNTSLFSDEATIQIVFTNVDKMETALCAAANEPHPAVFDTVHTNLSLACLEQSQANDDMRKGIRNLDMVALNNAVTHTENVVKYIDLASDELNTLSQ
jgi:hypothetical protein